jgi:hypothetical protein
VSLSAAAAVPSSFTLLGDDEEEGDDLSLATRRGAGAPATASPATGTAAAAVAPKGELGRL